MRSRAIVRPRRLPPTRRGRWPEQKTKRWRWMGLPPTMLRAWTEQREGMAGERTYSIWLVGLECLTLVPGSSCSVSHS